MELASISLAEGVGLVRRGDTGTSEKKHAKDEEGVAGDPISERDGVLATAPEGLACSISNILLSFVYNKCCHHESWMRCFAPGWQPHIEPCAAKWCLYH